MARSGYLKIVDHQGRKISASTPSVAPSYEATGWGRRLGNWGMNTLGPNAVLWSSITTLRSRVRELVRNNPLAQNGLDTLVANLVGTGITPRWQLEDAALKAQIQELWSDWVKKSDAYGVCDFYGQQAQVARGLAESGEIFPRFRPRFSSDNLPVPFQIQLLEADYLDESYRSMNGGNEIRMGIEFDPIGRRAAYWMWNDHPGEMYQLSSILERARVPASEILHIFRPLRPGQARGLPWLSAIIVQLHELDQYEDAELVRKKTAAMFGGFITEPPGEDVGESPLGMKTDSDSSDREVIAMEPGTFPTLPPGMEVTFSNPVDVGQTYEVWIKQQLREVAAGMGVTYEQLTQDLTGVNYSSIRAGLLEFRRRCQMLQAQTLVFQFSQPVAERFMDLAVASGALNMPGYYRNRRIYQRIEWRGQGWAWVDPVKDVTAEIMAIRAGLKSRQASINDSGGDAEVVDRQIKEDNDRADENGFVFDSDPRKTAKTGAIQAAETATVKEAVSSQEGE